MGHPKDQLIFVGTYTNLGAKGIYTCHMDGATGPIDGSFRSPPIADPTLHSSRCIRTAITFTRLLKSTILKVMTPAVFTLTP